MPVRIMHVVDHLGRGGLENGVVNLINHLDPSRFEHVVYAVRRLGPNADKVRTISNKTFRLVVKKVVVDPGYFTKAGYNP